MNWKTTTVLFAIVLGLGLYIKFYESKKNNSGPRTPKNTLVTSLTSTATKSTASSFKMATTRSS